MDVSVYDRWVIQFGNVYLVAVAYEDTKMCRLSDSPYDAATIDVYEDAMDFARHVGGKAVKFNPVTGVVGQ